MSLEDKVYQNQFERNVVGNTIKSISNKWTFYILKDLFLGKNHFTEFQQNRPNLDNKSLTRCLKLMESNNIIGKNVEGNETEYFLTSKGRRLNRVFYELIIFALETNEDDFFSQEEIDFLKRVYIDILDL
jgi:DNA-binding HxlR family transcriptional regulator